MSVGVLAHLFGSLPYRELAAKIGNAGFSHIQLALWKAVSDVDFTKAGRLSPGLVMGMAEEFRKHGVTVSVLGCYLHFFHRDPVVLRENKERFKELIRYAHLFGAPMVAAETGTHPNGAYHELDWIILRETVKELAEEAEKWGVFIGLEAANGHLVGTARELNELLIRVPSSHIGVVLDPGNLLHEGNIDRQDEVIREAFDLLGSHIIACHAKDRKRTEDGRVITVAPGLGDMNYPLYMRLLQQYKPEVHMIMEQASEQEMAACKRFIEETRAEAVKLEV
ncbi:sugar phosphate isomerase/epimerase [Paenibacillus sp. P96]|uniref:Sugar phosphate isomerase/epimerase n=1 Tax=Paenibacillus zeirhizosphaerae TaxID=2987519 RepID=A0ABT9FR91_9BACL|nr:sugar phosphate isomerase/epimerase [Paenibacillus sp. P96]MDP4097245.1 sugar phosphate isomerase/epimerase [Paenibacillus sp. P96]